MPPLSLILRLSSEEKTRIKAEWRSESRSCTDIHKKAVYCAFTGDESSEVSDNLENWLWQKLTPCSFDCSFSTAVFKELERLIGNDYGTVY